MPAAKPKAIYHETMTSRCGLPHFAVDALNFNESRMFSSEMKSQLKLGAALFFATGALVVGAAAPANAAACPNSSPALSTLTPAPFSCDQGGFTFTLFSYSGFNDADAISFSNPTANEFTYSINSNSPWTSGSKSLSYTLAAPTGKILKYYTAAASSSVPNPKAGTFTVASTTEGTAVGAVTNGSATSGEYDYTSPSLSLDIFTATLASISGNGIQSVQSTYGLVTSSAVPGPLPIFGAAAGFGLSRRIRSRIKAAA